jgi:ABC-type bacteriocin/lantibiotic exporter with double-glycine peptidase domain
VLRRTTYLIILTFAFATLAVASETSGVWLDVPWVQQDTHACGAASISMLMQYWAAQQGNSAGAEADATAIQRQIYSKKARGIFASDLKRYVDEHGFRTFVFTGGWDDLQGHLAKGRPLIVALGVSGRRDPLHYVVVAGLDWDHHLVFLNDPVRGKLFKMNWRDFDRDWAITEHWTLLAVPR